MLWIRLNRSGRSSTWWIERAFGTAIHSASFRALSNRGPTFKFNEAISLQVNCETQEEVDCYWDALSKGGDAKAQQCGWLKDKYGVSWQVVPTVLQEIMTDPDPAKSGRAMEAMLR